MNLFSSIERSQQIANNKRFSLDRIIEFSTKNVAQPKGGTSTQKTSKEFFSLLSNIVS
jgi:hypothetical protein